MGHDTQLRDFDTARLDSWKEIASFLHRDPRTVRRWERERNLPVHRVPGGERSGVFAYVSELESWLHATEPIAEDNFPEKPSLADEAASDLPNSAAASGVDVETVSLEESPDESDLAAASAFHSLNSFETTFAGVDPAVTASVGPVAVSPAAIKPAGVSRTFKMSALAVIAIATIGISAAVVHYREKRLAPPAAHRATPEAQELYLRGRYYWNMRTEESLNSAVDLFTQAIVNDPHYAPAYAGLADSYLLLRQYGHMPNSEAFPRALAAAQQSVALDDSLPEAHRSLAFILRFWNWDMRAAEKEYRRAIALNPNDSQSHHWYATSLLSAGRTHEALTQIDIARKLEPQSVSVLADRGVILASVDPQAGIVALKQVEQDQPSFLYTHIYLSGVYLEQKDYENFLSESASVAELSRNAAMVSIVEHAQTTLATRGPGPMLQEIAAAYAPLADKGSFPAYTAARLFGYAGDKEQAIRYLRLACEHREPGFLGVQNDAAFSMLRSSPEYNTLISRRDTAFGNAKQPLAKLDAPGPI